MYNIENCLNFKHLNVVNVVNYTVLSSRLEILFFRFRHISASEQCQLRTRDLIRTNESENKSEQMLLPPGTNVLHTSIDVN